MTVAELIRLLQEYPDDFSVTVFNDEYGRSDEIESIKSYPDSIEIIVE